MVVSRGLFYMALVFSPQWNGEDKKWRMEREREKKLLAASVSRYLLLFFSSYMCVYTSAHTRVAGPTRLTAKCCCIQETPEEEEEQQEKMGVGCC